MNAAKEKKQACEPSSRVFFSYLSALIKVTEALVVIIQAVSWAFKQQSHSVVQDLLCSQATIIHFNGFCHFCSIWKS